MGDMSDWADAMAEQADSEEAEAEAASAAAEAEKAELEQLDADAVNAGLSDEDLIAAGGEKIDAILDIPVSISMEVGRSNITIRNLLQLNQGSVIELDRVAGESLDVLVNGTLIAHGEVVVVNDKFGIRLTDVISQTERIKKLR